MWFSQFYLWLRTRIFREEGQDLIEYALLIALIALIVVVALTPLGQGIRDVFIDIGTSLGISFP